MWLIKTDSLQLEWVPDPEDLEYAILSHTWEEEEVSFQQFQKLDYNIRQMKGFAKIEKTCQLARTGNLDYAWVDTCCIDKTNNVELTEAINSMFQWYKKSSICFVYLSDWKPLDSDGLSFEESLAHMGECRWFTRGWTLQELIAPENVIFFDGAWQGRCFKDDAIEKLSKITGIDGKALLASWSFRSLELSVATKMSWAASRRTSRPEDRAYCLLGLFDITMPLIYGEGSKAFLRLQEEIARETNDLSLFAWQGDATSRHDEEFGRYWGMFANSPSEFAQCKDIRALRPSARLDQEYSITNKGIRMETNLLITESNYVLLLECYDASSQVSGGPGIGIYLTLLETGYVRSRSDELFYSNKDSAYPMSGNPRRIYISKRQPKVAVFFDAAHRHIGLERARVFPQGPYKVIAAGPASLWDYSRGYFVGRIMLSRYAYLHICARILPQKLFQFMLIFDLQPNHTAYIAFSQHDAIWADLLTRIKPRTNLSHDDLLMRLLDAALPSDSGARTTTGPTTLKMDFGDSVGSITIIPPEVGKEYTGLSPKKHLFDFKVTMNS